jgi:CheY-like chemotaxis protein
MTADDNESVKRWAMEIGCRDFLRKPFSADALIGALVNLSPRSAVSIPRSRSRS